MGKARPDLQEFLESYVGVGVEVYSQPPPSVKMVYPCVRITYNRVDNVNADNIHYLKRRSYTLTVIDYDIDSEISEKIGELPYCSYDRFYTANELNHFVYTLYY